MTFLKSALLSAVALAALSIPATAHAITVDCELKDGSTCTVSNDPFDNISCECSDEGGSGSVGGNDWADFDEDMLLEVCMAELDFCSGVETGGMTTGATSTSGASTSGPTTVGDTGGSDTEGDTDGTGTSGTTGATTSGATSDGGTGDGSSSTGEGPGSGGGPSTDPAETTGSSASGGDDGGSTTTGPAPEPGGDGSSSGADETSEDPSGCSVDPHSRGGALLALFGLVLGIRRRRVR